jgi:hypothetical protein
MKRGYASRKVYFSVTVAMKYSLPIFALKSPNNIRMSYLQAFHILQLLYFPAYKTHWPIRCTLIFSLEVLEKIMINVF